MTAVILLSLALLVVVPTPAADLSAPKPDLAEGHKLFTRCRICHTIEKGAQSMVGPNLHGLFGRKAGSFPGFPYSAAMSTSGVTWNDDTLAKYLRDPQAFIPGDRMAFPGIKDDQELADLIAYLKQVTR